MFEAITLVQTGKIDRFPIILYGAEFWEGLKMGDTTLKGTGKSANDTDLIRIANDADQVVEIIEDFYQEKGYTTNF